MKPSKEIYTLIIIVIVALLVSVFLGRSTIIGAILVASAFLFGKEHLMNYHHYWFWLLIIGIALLATSFFGYGFQISDTNQISWVNPI